MKLFRCFYSIRVLTIITIALLEVAVSVLCWRPFRNKCSIRTAAIDAVPRLVSVEAMRAHTTMNMLRRLSHRLISLNAHAFIPSAKAFCGKVKQPVFTGVPKISPLTRRRDTSHHEPFPAYPFFTGLHVMSTARSSDQPKQTTLESLNIEEKSIYNELLLLSEKIRMLDAAYYGRNNDEMDGAHCEVSDDEYDALARREAEICTKYPHLLVILEAHTGLGTKATRFGGRVGQVYPKNDEPDGDRAQLKQESKPAKKATKRTAKKRIKRQHLPNAPMQSLDNAMDETEAVAWINRVRKLLLSAPRYAGDENIDPVEFPITIIAEPKIDGLSLSLRYERQNSAAFDNQCAYKFVWAATRGDGSQGEDVTDAVQAAWMKNGSIDKDNDYSVPDIITINLGCKDHTALHSSFPSVIEIRGEVVLPQESFEQFSREASQNRNSTSFSNARNAASGILLRSKEPKSHEEFERTRWLQSRLRFYAYDIVMSRNAENEVTWSDQLICSKDMRKLLTGLGFDVPNPIVSDTVYVCSERELNPSNMSNLLDYHDKLMAMRDESVPQSSSCSRNVANTHRQNHQSPYQIDGVVYKLSDFRDRQICGSSSRTPRWALAHKFPPMSAVTKLLDIDIQVGRTGALTPVAVLEPVDLGGVFVSRASLHNFHFARKVLVPETELMSNKSNKKVKRGILVLVSRAGDVIPQVTKRIFDDAAEDEIDGIRDVHESKCICLEPPPRCPACGSPTTFEFVTSRSENRSREKKKKSLPPIQNESKSSADVVVKLDDDQRKSIKITDKLDLKASSSDGKDTGQILRCSGPQLLCKPRAVNALVHAYSRAGLDVKGLSSSRLQQLMEEDIIRFPADLFLAFGRNIEDSASVREDMLDRIAALPGWGAVSAENLADSVQLVASTGVSLSRFIYSLGIPFIGIHAAQVIASSYKNVNAFISALDEASNFVESNLVDNVSHPFVTLTGDETSDKVKGIGPVALSALLTYSKEEVLLKAAKDLAGSLTINDDPAIQIDDFNNENSVFKGMSIVFTGTLPISRTSAQTAVKLRGAKSTPNTISKSTTLVVVGEKGGKKAKQANEMGIQVMQADEFMRLISP